MFNGSDEDIQLLGQLSFPQERCIDYLTPDEAHEEIRSSWQSRELKNNTVLNKYDEIYQFFNLSFVGMQNLSISCSLVCLIVLGSAVFVGFFGLYRNQISAVLVTGVMYLLAGKKKLLKIDYYCLLIFDLNWLI